MSFVRAARLAVASGRKYVARNKFIPFQQQQILVRNFGAVIREPEYMVEDEDGGEEDDVEDEDINFPLMYEDERVDIYKKFCEDPTTWSAKNLSIHYKADLNRIKGILMLYDNRKAVMKERGLTYDMETGLAIIEPLWQTIYDKMKEEPTTSYDALADALEMPGQAAEVERIHKMMEWNQFHQDDLEEAQDMFEEMMDEYEEEGGVDTSEFREVEKEPGENVGGKTNWADKYYPRLLGDDQFEDEKARLLARIESDTKAVPIRDFAYYMRKNLKNIPAALVETPVVTPAAPVVTKPVVAPVADAAAPVVAADGTVLESPEAIVAAKEGTAGDESNGAAPAVVAKAPVEIKRNEWGEVDSNDFPNVVRMAKPVHDHSKVEKFSRYKIAFRDISYLSHRGGKGSLKNEDPAVRATQDRDSDGNLKHVAPDTRRRKNIAEFAAPGPTMILTRGGVWRRANPMEEAMRSWTRHPTYVDLNGPVNRDRVNYYRNDWDGDEELVKAQEAKKKEKRKAAFASIKK